MSHESHPCGNVRMLQLQGVKIKVVSVSEAKSEAFQRFLCD